MENNVLVKACVFWKEHRKFMRSYLTLYRYICIIPKAYMLLFIYIVYNINHSQRYG